MSEAAFEKVSAIIGDEMNKAWKNIISDLADVARGQKPISTLNLGDGQTLNLDDLRGFFAVAGGANLGIEFPSVVARNQVGLFRAAVVQHGVAPTKGPAALLSGEVSIGVSIRF